MFHYIKGKVTDIAPYLAVVECSGIGFAVNTTANTLSGLKPGEDAKLYTYLHVREGCFDLYGFGALNEKRLFEMLLSVSGVGPKAAVSILSTGTPESLATALIRGDEAAFTAAPGIGKKTAARIILELRDKVARDSAGPAFKPGAVSAPESEGILGDAAQALAFLGYTGGETARALTGIDPTGLSLEEIIKEALKKMLK